MAIIQKTQSQIAADKVALDKQERDRKEIDRLRSKNEVYDLLKPEWDFMLAAYEGGKNFVTSKNIWKHQREHDDDYKDRVKRAHYLNYCAPLVEFFTDFIFEETIHRDAGKNKEFFNDFIQDVNKKGDDITAFMSEVSDDDQIFGIIYVLVDAPKESDRPLTKAEEQKLGVRPYWVLIQPSEIYDWIVDSFDKLLYLKRVQFVEQMVGGAKQKIERYYEWTPTTVDISDIDVTEENKPILLGKETVTNKLGEIPIVPVRYKRSKENPFMGVSFLTDLAYNNREVMNLTSLVQEFLYRQCFNILAMEADTSVPIGQQQEGDVGISNVLEHPKGTHVPTYIAPSSDPAKFIQEERQRLINEMYKQAAQDTVNELFNGGKASGFSKAQSFSTTVPKIAARAEVLEAAENKLFALTMKYVGKIWDGRVKYKDRYEITNITDALTQLTMLFKDHQMPSETFVKTELKRMVHEYDGKMTPDLIQKIEKEIETMDFPEWQKTQKLALIANAGQPKAQPTDTTGPVKGKDTKAGAAVPVRAQSTTAEIKAEATKTKK